MIYYIIFGVLCLFSFAELFCNISCQTKKIIIFLFSLCVIFLSTIYWGKMGDYVVYKYHFESIANGSVSVYHYESLYEMLNYIVAFFAKKYWVLRLVLSTFVTTIWYRILFSNIAQKGKYAITIVFIMWALTFYNLFIIRSTIAVSICTYSIKYIETKNFKKFLICLLLAIGFHTMSWIWVISYWIYNKVSLRKVYYIILGLMSVFSSSIIKLIVWISSYFGTYIHNKITTYIAYGKDFTMENYGYTFIVVKAVVNIAFLLVIFELISYFKRKKQPDYSDNSEQLINLYMVGSILYIATLSCSVALARAALLFTDVQYFLLPQVFDLVKSAKNRVLIFIVFSVYLLLRLYITIESASYIPFETLIYK